MWFPVQPGIAGMNFATMNPRGSENCPTKSVVMIFVTVGTQLPFDRLIQAVDELAPSFPENEIIAQVYRPGYIARNIRTLNFISPIQYNDYIMSADLVISHAGIGTITMVAEMEKPLILFPRMGQLKEHRDDHQLATCKMLAENYPLNIAYDKQQLFDLLVLFREGRLPPTQKIAPVASTRLVKAIRDFISAGGK